jgi:outer membrane immunogenic protein
MKAIGIGLLVAVGLLGPTFAVAQDAVQQQRLAVQPRQASQPQGAPNWSGGQIGGSSGVSFVSNGFVEPGAYLCNGLASTMFGVNCIEIPLLFNGHTAGFTTGSFFGYRWQTGNNVAGFEADWSWKNGASSLSSFVSPAPAGANATGTVHFPRSDLKTGSVDQNWDSSVRMRYGYLVTPSTLAYATGGLALGRISGTFTYNGVLLLPFVEPGSATANSSWSDIRPGATFGAGVETEVRQRWKIRAEYRYTEYGRYTKNAPVTTACASCTVPSSNATIELYESFHSIRIGLGIDF